MGDFDFTDLFTPSSGDDSYFNSLFGSNGSFDPTGWASNFSNLPNWLDDYTPSDPGAGGQYDALFGQNGMLSGGGGSNIGSYAQTILKALGLTRGDGSANLSALLPSLMAMGGGIYGAHQTGKATQQTVNGINDATAKASQMLTGAQGLYNPYVQAGQGALNTMTTQAPSNLAGNFKPLASQNPLTLARVASGR